VKESEEGGAQSPFISNPNTGRHNRSDSSQAVIVPKRSHPWHMFGESSFFRYIKTMLKYQISLISGNMFHAVERTDVQSRQIWASLFVILWKRLKMFLNLRFRFCCKVPNFNITLRLVYVTALVGINAVVAGLGGIMLLVAICLIVGAIKVSDTFTLLSTLWPFPMKQHTLG
jgi:hypothetical protein